MNRLIRFFFNRPILLMFVAILAFCLTAWFMLEFNSSTRDMSGETKAILFILFTIAAIVYAILLNSSFRITKILDKIIEKYTKNN